MKCPDCSDPDPGVLRLFADGPLPDLRVGSLVTAKKSTGVCDAGERGVVYEVHRLHNLAGWGILFAGGGHDSFNAREVECFLTVTGEVCGQLQGYVFRNVRRLVEDFEGGMFGPAFKMAHKA